ncbi:hypothetical protein SK854_30225 [Lentzea sp. BCCO 10_0061]|uniref:Uncharacterized protein n=1 Tax=Lentzea sokolovensis TaxID=3095429 RepID=A0ABU4V3P8_9PSEU|nr:hypothetical protein [Lentzea sp. BCCO 10_0061]MDX8146425.1 hypothetical protein [Lentzea sp. BCCO 10_0061]
MKIRLEGTRDEIDAAVPALAHGFEVLQVSSFYPNRGTSMLGRVYVTATVLPAHLDSDPPPQLTS